MDVIGTLVAFDAANLKRLKYAAIEHIGSSVDRTYSTSTAEFIIIFPNTSYGIASSSGEFPTNPILIARGGRGVMSSTNNKDYNFTANLNNSGTALTVYCQSSQKITYAYCPS